MSRSQQQGTVVASRKSRTKTKTKTNANSRWRGKKFRLDVGDIVSFHTPNMHVMGNVGTVIGWLNKNEVLVLTFGGTDTDYPPQHISMRAQQPNESYNGPDPQPHYSNYVKKIIHRVNPQPVKKPKVVKFYEVTPDVLPDVLSGAHEVPEGHKVVLVPVPDAADDTQSEVLP